MYRVRGGELEVLLVHPGGPYWKDKDDGIWTIPKGELSAGEDELAAAQREFREETGVTPRGPFLALGQVVQRGGKIVHGWAWQGDCDPAALRSNTCRVQWPPQSGLWITCPEVDRAGFFTIEQARHKINPAQIPFLDELNRIVRERKVEVKPI